MKWLEVAPNENELTTFILYEKQAMLAQNPNANVKHPNIILSTNDINSTYDEIRNKGVIVGDLMEMPYGKMFKFSDLDNNEYLVREDK